MASFGEAARGADRTFRVLEGGTPGQPDDLHGPPRGRARAAEDHGGPHGRPGVESAIQPTPLHEMAQDELHGYTNAAVESAVFCWSALEHTASGSWSPKACLVARGHRVVDHVRSCCRCSPRRVRS
jgi:hypothetical protein